VTFRQAIRKKYGQGLLKRLLLAARILHVFDAYAREYEKGLSEEQRKAFRKVFGERG
jgi:hypothetical protein